MLSLTSDKNEDRLRQFSVRLALIHVTASTMIKYASGILEEDLEGGIFSPNGTSVLLLTGLPLSDLIIDVSSQNIYVNGVHELIETVSSILKLAEESVETSLSVSPWVNKQLCEDLLCFFPLKEN